jgi:hypothetical protein
MCTYISAIIPKGADLERLSTIAGSFGKDIRPFGNASIQRQLRRDEALFLTTKGHCDCGSALGSDRHRRRKVRDLDNERAKLAKKGWSTGKIEKALSQRAEHIVAEEQDLNSQIGKDLDNWLGFIRTALTSGSTPYVGLLTHHYSGNIEAEAVQVSAEKDIGAVTLDHATLTGVDEDVIYRISPHA